MLRLILSVFIVFSFSGNCYAEQNNKNWDQLLYNSIHFAENGNEVVVELDQIKECLQSGANPNWINSKPKYGHQTVLSQFVGIICISKDQRIRSRGYSAIKLLFDNGAKIQKLVDDQILFMPVASNFYDLTKLLLEKGVSAKSWPKKIGTEFTPIEYAAKEGNKNIVNLLSEYGAIKVDKKDIIQSRFIEVASFGTVSELDELIKNGARINERNKDRETALLNAITGEIISNSSIKKVVYLLSHGADPNYEGNGMLGFLPLHVATIHTSFVFRYDNRDHEPGKKIIQLLLENGAYVSGKDQNGLTPLHCAAKYNNIFAARLFLIKGAKVMPRDNKGKTPLDYAESAEMIKLLKEFGASEL